MIAERESITVSDVSDQPLPSCRFCSAPLRDTFVDLGLSPLCERYLGRDQLNQAESFYPLHVRVCRSCFLVQLEAYVTAEDILPDDTYFSSCSDSRVEYARVYADLAATRLRLNDRSFVVELASNDGYLLEHFVMQGMRVLGIEPALNVAAVAEQKGVPTATHFFGVDAARRLSQKHGRADLIIANNVLAQVPDLNDFVGGIPLLLAWNGTVTLEFGHLARLIEGNQFDTIYHDNYSYFSLYTTEQIFAQHGLRVYDVEELPTLGGSLRVWGCHAADARRVTGRLRELRARELADGVDQLDYYAGFAERVIRTIEARRQGTKVVVAIPELEVS
jgi:hypothetical protein